MIRREGREGFYTKQAAKNFLAGDNKRPGEVIANEAKQSLNKLANQGDCFVAALLAMTGLACGFYRSMRLIAHLVPPTRGMPAERVESIYGENA